MAGTGKSTIARTVAREYDNQERLGASFFFSRGGGDVSHANKFVTTIARQLANDSCKRYISEAIAKDPKITTRGLSYQWNQLVLQPLSKLYKESTHSPLLLVIDALDECEGDEDIKSILQLLANPQNWQNAQLRIFLTSRPEIPIRYNFYRIPEAKRQDFVLHNISSSIIEHDISVFLDSELEEVRHNHELSADWPGERYVQLIESAGGLFIYTATACRFLKDSRFPEDDVDLILQGNIGVDSPQQRLDLIYTQVLNSSVFTHCPKRNEQKQSAIFKQVIGSLVVLFDSISPQALSGLLRISPEETKGTILLN
ncbi:hypothetical protein AOQ84DRAFT_322981, partial [Glonium stellatum]